MKEAEKILHQPVPLEEVKQIERKQNYTQVDPIMKRSYDNIASCYSMMSMGFIATKYNFQNSTSRKVIVRLSACRTKLVYTDLAEKKGLRSLLGPSVKSMAKFQGIIYGGKTPNFRKHRQLVRSKFED